MGRGLAKIVRFSALQIRSGVQGLGLSSVESSGLGNNGGLGGPPTL